MLKPRRPEWRIASSGGPIARQIATSGALVSESVIGNSAARQRVEGRTIAWSPRSIYPQQDLQPLFRRRGFLCPVWPKGETKLHGERKRNALENYTSDEGWGSLRCMGIFTEEGEVNPASTSHRRL